MFLLWTKIRGLGELQVLTKVSYLLLIMIPLLAALWPGVKIVINQYNNSLHSSISVLENSATRLELESKRIENNLLNKNIPINKISNNAQDIISQVEVQIEEIKKNIVEASIKRNTLPSTWAFLFFASLFVFIAHLIYQIFVPELIKEKSIDDYISSKKEEYSKNPNQKALDYAKAMVNHTPLPWIQELPAEPDQNTMNSTLYKEKMKRWELDIIESGSQSRYLIEAKRNPIAIIISGFLYLVGVIIILGVIIQQSLSVASAAGWIT